MAFPPLPKYVRNDPYGPTGHNSLLQRQDFLYDFHGVEHDPSTGEHNTPHVARTLGRILWDGAKYVATGFNADVSLATGNHPATGTVILTLAANRYSASEGILEIQPCDDSGGSDGHPWVVSAQFTDDTHVTVFQKKNTAALGVQQVFAATDGAFFIGIRGPHLPDSVTRPTGAPRRARGDGLAADASNWNPMIQAVGDNRAGVLAAHTSVGLHNAHEVSKAWGCVRWDSASSSYFVVAHQGLGAGVQRIGTGQVRVYLANAQPAMVAPVQAFVQPVTLATGVDHTGLVLAHAPTTSCVAASVDVFLYESVVNVGGSTEYRWQRADFDFYIRVHGA